MDYQTLLRAAERGQPPPVALLHGSDGQLLDDALSAVGRGLFADASQATFDREVLDGREVSAEAIVRAASTLPVMAPRRLVAVRHCQTLPAKGGEVLGRYAQQPNPDACLLLLADEPLGASRERKDHWLLGAVPAGAVVALPSRQGRALEDWLRQRAALEGIEIAEEAARLLVEWVGDDGPVLLGEARKAALAGGPEQRAVGVKDVAAVVGERRMSGVFDLTRAVERRQTATALKLLETLLASEEPIRLIALLTNEVRTAWSVREGLRRGQSIEQLARTLRRPPGVIQVYAAAERGAGSGRGGGGTGARGSDSRSAGAQGADAGGSAALASKLRRCWEVERRLKSGGDARGELVALVAELCTR